jgi:non-specific serine/threonine protein kinase
MLQSLLAALGNARLLLVLDNLEHLMGAELQSLVNRLVQACPGITILTTSREPLQLGLEQRMVVSPMQLPEGGEPANEVARAESVQLFLSRARTVASEFAPGPDDLRSVGEICRRVEGLPLAIELAAAWMRVVSPAALLAQLDEQLPLLAGGAADQPARLRTMRDAIAWSYDRLPAEEAALLRKLSVFRGGFPLEGAERIVGEGDHSTPAATLRLIASLCDKHLLSRTDAIGEMQRFGMLETVREFAFAQLQASGELSAAQAAHAHFYLELMECAEPELLGPRENNWFAIYSAEASNLRQAISWGLANDADLALRLLAATWGYWSWRGVIEGLRLINAALALPDAVSPFVRARGLRTATALANLCGDFQTSTILAAEGVAFVERVDDRWLQGELLWNCACSAFLTGNLSQAVAAFDLALARMDAPNSDSERAIRAYARSHRAAAECLLGNVEHGAQDYTQSVEDLRQIGGVGFTIIVFSDAAGWLLLDGQTSKAKALLQEALRVSTHAHTSWLAMTPLSGLALIDALEGNAKRAARRLGASSSMAKRADLVIPPNFQAKLDRAAALASEALGPVTFRAEQERGRRNPAAVLQDALVDAREALNDDGAGERLSSAGITRRDREVLDLIVAGRTDRDIAAALFISERTASKHVSKILQKLDAVSRGDAAVRAVRLGLV